MVLDMEGDVQFHVCNGDNTTHVDHAAFVARARLAAKTQRYRRGDTGYERRGRGARKRSDDGGEGAGLALCSTLAAGGVVLAE